MVFVNVHHHRQRGCLNAILYYKRTKILKKNMKVKNLRFDDVVSLSVGGATYIQLYSCLSYVLKLLWVHSCTNGWMWN